MKWEDIFTLMDPMLAVVVAACWCLGYILKRTPHVPDWTIVYIVTIAALILVVWMRDFNPHSIMQGILCGAFSVYGHQILKQTLERK